MTKNKKTLIIIQLTVLLVLPIFRFVGMTGFEPATTRPPAVYANRTAPHPDRPFVNGVQRKDFLSKIEKNHL